MKKKIAVIGSGISGLSAAWYLAKANHEVTVFEKKTHFGGWIGSDTKNNFFFEKGPRSFSTSRSFDLLTLLDELKLASNIIYSSDDAKNRYLYIGKKLQKIPTSLCLLIFSNLTRRHVPALLKEAFKPKKLIEDETIYSFVERRFSKDIALNFFDPITTGIYGGDIRHLSIRSCFPSLYNLERRYGSLIKGLLFQMRKKSKERQKSLFTLKDGLAQIIHKIASIKNITALASTPVQKIVEQKNKVNIYTKGRVLEYDFAIIATPYNTINSFFYDLPFELDEIKYNDLATINLGFNNLSLPLNGFGYLVPRVENEKILGAVFDSNIFKEQNKENQARMTLMLASEIQKNNLKSFIKNILKRHLNIAQLPDYFSYQSFKNAVPQYHVGHKEKILKLEKNFESHFSRIFFTGNYLENVSVSGCIKKSKETVIKLENKFDL